MNKTEFLKIVENKIEEHHLLNHSFYKAWNAGELDRFTIQEYAAQYFKHVSAFPRYLSSIHSNCDNISVRQEILENLIDEIGATRALVFGVLTEMLKQEYLISCFINSF